MTVRLRLATWYGLSLMLALLVVGGIVWVWDASELDASMAMEVRSLADDSRRAAEQGTRPAALVNEDTSPDLFLVVFGQSVRLAASRGTPPDLVLPALGERRIDLASGPTIISAVRAEPGITIVAGASLTRVHRDLESLARTLVGGGGLVFLVAVMGGWWVSGRALAPVDAMTREAAAIGAGGRVGRLPEPQRRDELARLARTLNDMLGRVEAAVKRERAFIASASHDLRTPIAALLVELELARSAPPDPAVLRKAIADAHQDASRIAGIIDELLELARLEASGSPLRPRPVVVAALVASAIDRVRPEAAQRGVTIRADAPADVLSVDDVRVEQALVNLVSNAVEHGAERGIVEVSARILPADRAKPSRGSPNTVVLELEVSDRGPGVDGDLLARLFEPFSRGRGGAGIGLGLATAAAAARAHGGSIGYRDRTGGGACFWFRVPAEAAPPIETDVPQRRLRRTIHGRTIGLSRAGSKPPAT